MNRDPQHFISYHFCPPTYRPTFEEIKQLLGGAGITVEACNFGEQGWLYVDEDAKVKGHPPNPICVVMFGMPIFGNVVHVSNSRGHTS